MCRSSKIRFLSLLLILAVVFSSLPFTALTVSAEEETNLTVDAGFEEEEEETNLTPDADLDEEEEDVNLTVDADLDEEEEDANLTADAEVNAEENPYLTFRVLDTDSGKNGGFTNGTTALQNAMLLDCDTVTTEQNVAFATAHGGWLQGGGTFNSLIRYNFETNKQDQSKYGFLLSSDQYDNVLESTKASGTDANVKVDYGYNDALNKDKLFLLSYEELQGTKGASGNYYGNNTDQYRKTNVKGDRNEWWLRSPTHDAGNILEWRTYTENLTRCIEARSPSATGFAGVSPALNLDLSSVIFTSESKTVQSFNGVTNASTTAGTQSSPWVMGLKTGDTQPTVELVNAPPLAQEDVNVNGIATKNEFRVTAGAKYYNNVAAMEIDSNGNVVKFGKVNVNDKYEYSSGNYVCVFGYNDIDDYGTINTSAVAGIGTAPTSSPSTAKSVNANLTVSGKATIAGLKGLTSDKREVQSYVYFGRYSTKHKVSVVNKTNEAYSASADKEWVLSSDKVTLKVEKKGDDAPKGKLQACTQDGTPVKLTTSDGGTTYTAEITGITQDTTITVYFSTEVRSVNLPQNDSGNITLPGIIGADITGKVTSYVNYGTWVTGTDTTSPLKFRVLDTDSGKRGNFTDDAGTALKNAILLDCDVITKLQPYTTTYIGWIAGTSSSTDIRKNFINYGADQGGNYNFKLSAEQYANVKKSYKATETSSQTLYEWARTDPLIGDRLFLLSKTEAATTYYKTTYQNQNGVKKALSSSVDGWWLRSPRDVDSTLGKEYTVTRSGVVMCDAAASSAPNFGISPALNFDPSSVIFTSNNATVTDFGATNIVDIETMGANKDAWTLGLKTTDTTLSVTKIKDYSVTIPTEVTGSTTLQVFAYDPTNTDATIHTTALATVSSGSLSGEIKFGVKNVPDGWEVGAILTDSAGNVLAFGKPTSPNHTHKWKYTATKTNIANDTIKATCTNEDCTVDYDPTITVSATDIDYTGEPNPATLTNIVSWTDAGFDLPEIEYYQKQEGQPGSYNKIETTPTNAGEYKAEISVAGGGGEFGMSTVTAYVYFTINKVPATATTLPTTKTDLVYDGGAKELLNEGSGEEGGKLYYKLSSDTNWSTSVPTATDVGSYDVEYFVSATDINHYSSPVTTLTSLIAAKSLTVTASDIEKTYDGNSYGITVTCTDEQDATIKYGTATDMCTMTNSPKYKDKGEYTVYYEVSKENYATKKGSATVKINPREVTVSWSDLEFIYNGSPQKPTATVTNLVENDSCTVTVSGEQKNASSTDYTATATDLSNTNYTLPATNPTQTFKISPLLVIVSWSDLEFVYDGTVKTPTASATNLVGSDKCNIVVTSTGINATTTNIATATSMTGADSGNYSLTTTTTNFVIDPADIASRTTTSPIPDQIYTGSKITPTVTVTDTIAALGTLTSDTDYTVEYTDNIDVGTATVTITGKGNYENTTTTNFNITKSPLTLQVTASDITYGDTLESSVLTVTATDTNGNVVTGTSTWTTLTTMPKVSDSNVTKYEVTFKPEDSTNYATTTTMTTLMVHKRELTVSWSDLEFIYDGTVKTPTASATNLVENDKCDIVVTSTGINVGTHTATATDVTGTDCGNYRLTTTTTNFTIKQSLLTLGPTASDITYGQTLSNSVLTVTATDSNGHKVTGTSIWTTQATMPKVSDSNVTKYEVKFTPNDLTNYATTTTLTTLTVHERELTVSWSDLKFTYDGTVKTPTASATNLVGDDECNIVVTSTGINAGTHTATATNVTGEDCENYHLTTTMTNFVIEKADITDLIKTVNANISKGKGSTVNIQLPDLPEGGGMYGQPSTLSDIVLSTPTDSGLSIATAINELTAGNTYEFSIKVTSTNYQDYTINVILTAVSSGGGGGGGGGLFPQIIYTITATATDGGTISPDGVVKVVRGNDQSFVATPNEGYEFEKFVIDDCYEAKDGNTHTFKDVHTRYTIQAVFVKKQSEPKFTGWKETNGKWQYYKDGNFLTDWQNNIPGWEGQWFYFDNATGYAKSAWADDIHGWVGQWFYFNPITCVMMKGWVNDGGTRFFYLDDNTGVMKKGWHYLNWSKGANWFYFDNNGSCLTNTTTPDGYYVDGNGVWK